jgi:tRNA nucleotidyltransferase (CCA-adding enzyme)
MSDSERHVMLTMLKRLTDVMDEAKLTYYMACGTLIGSYRHHGLVPWDDDVDIYARWTERYRLSTVFKRRLSKDYGLVKYRKRLWKLYPKRRSVVMPRKRWKYPFIDIFFATEDKSSVWDNIYEGNYRYERSTVYPLRRRPFMELLLWAPNDVETYLKVKYDISKCKSNSFIHKRGKPAKGPATAVDCRLLWPYFPFVFRSKVIPAPNCQGNRSAKAVVEQQKIGDRVISKFVVSQE